MIVKNTKIILKKNKLIVDTKNKSILRIIKQQNLNFYFLV